MHVSLLELKNFSRHSSLTITPKSNIQAVLGGNGVGKSSVLSALEYGITGVLEDNQESYVRSGETSASVTVEFTHQGQRYKIFRSLGKSSKRYLETPEGKLTAAKEVDARMAKIVEVDKRTVAAAVFVHQACLQNLLFGTYVERRASLIRISNLAYLNQRAALMADSLKKTQQGLVDLAPLWEQVIRDMTNAQIAETTAEADLANYPDVAAELKKMRQEESWARQRSDLANQAVQLRQRYNEYNTRLAQEEKRVGTPLLELQAQIPLNQKAQEENSREVQRYYQVLSTRHQWLQAIATWDQADTALTVARRDLQAAIAPEATLDDCHRLRDSLLRELNRWQSYDAATKRLGVTMALRENTRKELAALIPPILPRSLLATQGAALHTARAVWSLAKTQLKMAEEVAGCLKPGETKCQKCGLELKENVALLPEQIAQMKEHLREEGEALAVRERENFQGLTVCQKYDLALISLNTRLDELEKRLKEEQEQMANLGPPPEVPVQTLKDSQNEIEVRIREGSRLIAAVNTHHGAMKQAEQTRDRLTKVLETMPGHAGYTNEGYQALQKVGADLQLAQKKLQADISQLIGLKANVTAVGKQMLDLNVRLHAVPPTTLSELELAGLSEIISRLDTTQRARDQAVGVLNQARASVQEQKIKTRDLEEREQQQARRKELVKDLEYMLSLLQESGLPQKFLEKQFYQLQFLTQKHLTTLDANFVLAPPDLLNLEMQFLRPGETTEPLSMTKLSGGQKIRLGLAFLLSVQELLVPQLGLLVLDEPSTHLDEEGVEALSALLAKLGGELSAGGMQIWLADHHPLLKNGLSDVCLLT